MSNFKNFNSYPSKIILFGEYTVILNGNVLAIPNYNYIGTWAYGKELSMDDFIDYIIEVVDLYPFLHFDKDKWYSFKDNKGYFSSNIPQGYGLGSSGAFVAAFYHDFILKEDTRLSIEEHKKILGKIESFFHGRSSGIDPLVSYLKKPILVDKDKIEILENFQSINYSLVDSGIPRRNNDVINLFLKKIENEDFKIVIEELKDYNNQAILSIINNDSKELKFYIDKISMLQFEKMSYLIPENIQKEWEASFETNYRYKLCGGGAGGFYLKFNLEDL